MDDDLRKSISDAIWKVMHGYDGRLLTGDFYPGHEAIVDAAFKAVNADIGSVIEDAINEYRGDLRA